MLVYTIRPGKLRDGGAGVRVSVAEGTGVLVGRFVGVAEGVGVRVAVGIGVSVAVAVAVGSGVGVGPRLIGMVHIQAISPRARIVVSVGKGSRRMGVSRNGSTTAH
jgi:hypothetical protein